MTEQGAEELRASLRKLRASASEHPEFDTDAAPADPLTLFREWLASAIASDVSQPHVMVLATATTSGVPSARSVLLKDVTDEGLWFASLSTSPKGRDLGENPLCAVTFYWREQGRQVRVAGRAKPGPREVSERDFLARHPKARAGAIAGTQSEPMVDGQAALAAAERTVAENENYVPIDWHAYVIEPTSVDFWQATADRGELRLRYDLVNNGWNAQVIWP